MTQEQAEIGLGLQICDDCGHALKYHVAEQYGCEIERGDGYRGAEFMEALGPCCCKGAECDQVAIAALRKVAQARRQAA